eukprot:1157352-Pelagomonas_calceolata.AAC.3
MFIGCAVIGCSSAQRGPRRGWTAPRSRSLPSMWLPWLLWRSCAPPRDRWEPKQELRFSQTCCQKGPKEMADDEAMDQRGIRGNQYRRQNVSQLRFKGKWQDCGGTMTLD